MSLQRYKIRIPRPLRDMRVQAQRWQTVCTPMPADKTHGFVRRILAKYAAGSRSWPHLNDVLLRPWIAWMPQVAQSLRMILAPRVNLAITAAADDARQKKTIQRQGPWEYLAGAGIQLRHTERWLSYPSADRVVVGTRVTPLRAALRRTDVGMTTKTRARTPTMEITRRLSARGERVEGGMYNAPRAAGRLLEAGDHPLKHRVVSAVPRVVRRNAGYAPTAESREPTARRTDAKAVGTRPVVAPPAIDVERLTSEVVRAIDRRIIAQRERLGGR